MENSEIQKLIKITQSRDTLSVSNAIRDLKTKGYTEDFSIKYDHFVFGDKKILPHHFFVDDLIRLENMADPDDNTIIYAVSANVDDQKVKGIYVESYGVYHESMSQAMSERIKTCRQKTNNTNN